MIFTALKYEAFLGVVFRKPENIPIEPDPVNTDEGKQRSFIGFWRNTKTLFYYTAGSYCIFSRIKMYAFRE